MFRVIVMCLNVRSWGVAVVWVVHSERSVWAVTSRGIIGHGRGNVGEHTVVYVERIQGRSGARATGQKRVLAGRKGIYFSALCSNFLRGSPLSSHKHSPRHWAHSSYYRVMFPGQLYHQAYHSPQNWA